MLEGSSSAQGLHAVSAMLHGHHLSYQTTSCVMQENTEHYDHECEQQRWLLLVFTFVKLPCSICKKK